MNWIRKLWPQRAKARSSQGEDGALAPSYGQDLLHPDELINRANKRAVRGDIEGAIADFDIAIELNPAKATAFYNRGYLHNLAGHHPQAIVDCSEAIALLNDYDEAFYQRGIAHQALGNFEAAIVDLSEVLRLNPFSIKAYYKRANCYAAQNDIQGAIADYTQAILRAPKDANAYLQRGLFLTKLQEYRTAIEDFSSALSFNPKSADAYYHRGFCYGELGQREKATLDFNQAMLYDPSQRAADFNRSYALGIIKESKNLPPAAPSEPSVDEFPTVLQNDEAVVLSLDSQDPPILETTTFLTPDASSLEPPANSTTRGQTSQSSTQEKHAEPGEQAAVYGQAAVPQSLQTPSEAVPSQGTLVRQTNVDVLFAEGQHKVQSGDFEGAIQTYSAILEIEPDNARAYLERGKSFNAVGEMNLAAADLDTAVHCAKRKSLDLMKDYSGTLADTLADLKGGLAQQYNPSNVESQIDNQAIEGAILKFSQAIHRNPLDPNAYFERAKSRALLGDLDGAIADYTRTISLNPQHREAYYKRGMLLEALGDEEGATEDLNRAIRRPPLVLPSSDAAPVKHHDQSIEKAPEQPTAKPTFMPVSETEEPSSQETFHPSVPNPLEAAQQRQTSLKPEAERHSERPIDAEQDVEPELVFDQDIALDQTLVSDQQLESGGPLEPDDALESDEAIDPEALKPEEDSDLVIPTYFSDLVLEPCNHEGNDPANRFCIHCGQPIQLASE